MLIAPRSASLSPMSGKAVTCKCRHSPSERRIHIVCETGLPLGEHPHHRPIFRRDGVAVVVDGGDARGPLRGGHFAGFVEALIEDRLGRLVVVDERALGVDEEDRRGDRSSRAASPE